MVGRFYRLLGAILLGPIDAAEPIARFVHKDSDIARDRRSLKTSAFRIDRRTTPHTISVGRIKRLDEPQIWEVASRFDRRRSDGKRAIAAGVFEASIFSALGELADLPYIDPDNHPHRHAGIANLPSSEEDEQMLRAALVTACRDRVLHR